ncbi:hypothetical protein EJP77_02775 [Paenibacillus zeisoli]|uniref:F0F1-type ATP synthase n=1 Tax=Paenibacillus zeisoli TaxID=2496267 RepID=A0A3S1DDL5_9BACL|nr:hypothetical protein [Paenibacillus zeisoli]RUT35940.1 hypothetical protein EJP77_02775 [Paenibacillus zeisoli]
MKITDLAVLFVLIVGPFLWVSSVHSQERLEAQRLSSRYTSALRAAVQDGGSQLNDNELQQYEAGYASDKYFRANRDQALDSLLHTLYLNFGIGEDAAAQRTFMNYIPAVVVMDYDGYYIYHSSEYTGEHNEPLADYRWSVKKPYADADKQGNVIHFTLDHYVSVYDSAAGKWMSGALEEIARSSSVSVLDHEDVYEATRRTVIVQSIEDDLANTINSHNLYAARHGITYQFTLPTISEEDWNNTLNDIGILVFLQGIPVGDEYYNNYALGGGRLVKRSVIHGGIDQATGIKYYYRASCDSGYKLEEVFTSEREAAAKGYFESRVCRKLP